MRQVLFGGLSFIFVALCLAGGCGGQAPARPCQRLSIVEWRSRDDDSETVKYLFVDGQQRGAYRWDTDEWRTFDPARETWGPPTKFFGWALRAKVPFIPE